MKKILTLVLAALLIISLLPLSVLAEEAPLPTDQAQVVIYYAPQKKNFTLTLKADTGAAYVAVNEDGTYGQWTGAEAPADKYVKFEYIAGQPATVKATFKNFNVDCTDIGNSGSSCSTMSFREGGAPYNTLIELIGDNSIIQSRAACISLGSKGNATITGSGSLTLSSSEGGDSVGSLRSASEELLIKDTTVNFNLGKAATGLKNGIVGHGSVTLDNVKSNSTLFRGCMIFLGTAAKTEFMYAEDSKYKVTIKNCDINLVSDAGTFCAGGAKPVISNSTLKLTKRVGGSRAFFVPAPVFEGDATVIAGLSQNAEKLDKLKVYKESNLSNYTYIYAVPGIVDLLPTEPEVNEPEVNEPEVNEPEVNEPEVNEPEVTEPEETTPETTVPQVTEPAATEPNATEPNATEPAATEPVDTTDDGEEGGNPLVTAAIIIGVLVVLAGGGVAALFILKKKGIIK